jgi:7,8-dihydropterin-6-yl-methyl-4-(beta-D-ribofuranosyl)aminobenzene 5'-phosphate synthase
MSTNNSQPLTIKEADRVEVLSLVDNSIDFLSTVDKKEAQSFRQWTKMHSELPEAQHGFAMLIQVFSEGKTNTILFDTGCSQEGVVKNAKRMGIDMAEVEYVVLSHGHYDHSGGLLSVLKEVNKVNLPIIVHEDMFKKRGTANQNGTVRPYTGFPTKEQLSSAQLISTKQPFALAGSVVLVSGEIPRETSFEKGYLHHRTWVNGKWEPDPLILDDRAVIINVKGKGLVVLSGCAHAGIINTVVYAQKITGTTEVCAVMGGFHLAGKENESRIEQTVEELKKINPKLIAPSHCTGWRGICAIANAMPNAFVWNSVGNLYKL